MNAKTNQERNMAGALVLGPGRSGTSAVVQAFVAAGYFAGEEKDLHGPAPTNPLGHFESLAVMEINEELLARFDCSWWAAAPSVDEQLPHREEVVPRLRAAVDALTGAAGEVPVVLKDPRINSLLPLWRPAIEGVLHPVIAVRDPLEIARSHSQMEGTSTVHALAAWEAQMTIVLQQLDGTEVTIAPYEQLTAQSQTAVEVVESASSRLGGNLGDAVRAADAASALRSDLRNQRSDEPDYGAHLTARQMLLWEYLRALPAGRARLAPPAELKTPSPATRGIARAESERVRLVEAHARLVDELARSNARAEDLQGRLASIETGLSWRLTAPLRRLRALLRRR